MSEGRRSRIEKLRAIVEHHQHAQVEGVRIDAVTASMLCTVYDALKTDAQRAKFNSRRWPLRVLVAFGWSVVK